VLMFTVSLTTSPASAGTLRQFFEDRANPSELVHTRSGTA
jgi:hypothetical protein